MGPVSGLTQVVCPHGTHADLMRSAYFSGNALERLRLQRRDLARRLEQSIRATMHRAGATYASIRLSSDAYTAAQENLQLLNEAYGRGRTSILDVLDAQNAAITAEEGLANAEYDFLLDLMAVERAIGKFYFFADQAQREAWFARLDAFYQHTLTANP
ncbi:MAG: hypothetical protein GKR89_32730 [Candidatus Latescibacteria bacterium]|nr:hypothetical protein [Candidatus Latescibacterota bacterium]